MPYQKRMSLSQSALIHTKEMEDNYEAEIDNAISKTEIFRNGQKLEEMFAALKQVDFFPVEQKIVDMDTVSAIFLPEVQQDIAEGKRVAVLNFASYKNPGGKFLDGSSAQEEALCHSSFLYNVLESQYKDYYVPNQRNTNQALYTNAALYSKDVRFWAIHPGEEITDETPTSLVDVITCAAPNKKAHYQYYSGTSWGNMQALENRVAFVSDVIDIEGVDTFIAGAWGSGVFGQDPRMVAEYFNKYFRQSNVTLSKVIYAVPQWLGRANWLAFREKIQLYNPQEPITIPEI